MDPASPKPHRRLPASTTAFRQLVRECRSAAQRDSLLDRVRAEHPSFEVEPLPWPPRPARLPPDARRFESRLIALAELPKFDRDFPHSLRPSYGYAWQFLTRFRSPRFAAMLRRWMDADDSRLAAVAAQHLAWMAFDRDLLRFRRAMMDGPWRLRGAIGEGLASTLSHRWASRTFRTRMFELLASIQCGEVPIPMRRELEGALAHVGDGLVALDRAATRRLYRRGRALHPRNRAVAGIIFSLEFEQGYGDGNFRPVDPRLLWPIYEALRSGGLRLPTEPGSGRRAGREHTMGGILLLAADRDPERVERECRALLQGQGRHHESTLARYARSALRRCRNIPEVDAVLRASARRGAIRGDALRVIRAYSLMHDVVQEGLAYCLSYLNDRWRPAQDGLLVLEKTKAAAILAEAGATFDGSAFARLPRSRRLDQELDDKVRAALDALDLRLNRHWESVSRAAQRYIEEHPLEFAAAAPRRRRASASA